MKATTTQGRLDSIVDDCAILEKGQKKWQVALVKLDPWRELIWRQVEKRSASWYSFKYRLVFDGTGSEEGTTWYYLEKLGQY